MLLASDLPDDIDALRALIVEQQRTVAALTSEVVAVQAEVDRLTGAEAEAEAEIAG